MILGILQARMSSSRLPGKALKSILGKPMLALQIERTVRSRQLSLLVVATGAKVEDQPIADLCSQLHIPCFRGSPDDVLDRFYRASQQFNADHIVRVTGDCPLIDPKVIDQTISFYTQGHYDYASNALEPSFPDGLDTEVFRFSSLETAWHEATLSSEREHVTPFFYNHPERFKIGTYKNKTNLSQWRWTVDEPADFDFVSAVYRALYPDNPDFSFNDILVLLEKNLSLKALNHGLQRNEGYLRSLDNDIDGGTHPGRT